MYRVQHDIIGAANTTDTQFYMLIDLSNASGFWKHGTPGAGKGIRVYGLRTRVDFPTAADLYRIEVGVVLRADATNADVALIDCGTGAYEKYDPHYLDWKVASGALANAYGTKTLVNSTLIQTDVNLTDPQGNNVLPAAGDVVWRVISTKTSPAGSIAYACADIWYAIA